MASLARLKSHYGMARPWLALALCPMLAIAAIIVPAGARETLPFGPDLKANNWSTILFTPFSRARFTPDGATSLRIEADKAAGLIWKPVGAGLRDAEAASWRWKAEAAAPATDLTRKGGDDRVISVYFLFGADSDVGRSATAVLRSDTARALVYVFGGNTARGTVLPSPHMGERGRFIISRTATAGLGQWFSEKADIRKDFQRAFGAAAPLLIGVAISSDSDDTGSLNRAALADFVVH